MTREPRSTVLVVHGFAVKSIVFSPLISRLNQRSLDATLFRYPSVGFSLSQIVDRLSVCLREKAPDAVIAHSLGCMATSLAVRETGWTGPIVFLAPPFSTLPLTRLIPEFLRWPFKPLIDHRALTSSSTYQPPRFIGCSVKSIVGRFDGAVPMYCSHNDNVDEQSVLPHTHNSLLFSSVVADLCSQWIAAHKTHTR
jgi:hypothetical protein